MAKFQVVVAFDAPCYIQLEIESESLEDVLIQLKAKDQDESLWSNWTPDWDLAGEHRVVSIIDEKNNILVEHLDCESDEWKSIPEQLS